MILRFVSQTDLERAAGAPRGLMTWHNSSFYNKIHASPLTCNAVQIKKNVMHLQACHHKSWRDIKGCQLSHNIRTCVQSYRPANTNHPHKDVTPSGDAWRTGSHLFVLHWCHINTYGNNNTNRHTGTLATVLRVGMASHCWQLLFVRRGEARQGRASWVLSSTELRRVCPSVEECPFWYLRQSVSVICQKTSPHMVYKNKEQKHIKGSRPFQRVGQQRV